MSMMPSLLPCLESSASAKLVGGFVLLRHHQWRVDILRQELRVVATPGPDDHGPPGLCPCGRPAADRSNTRECAGGFHQSPPYDVRAVLFHTDNLPNPRWRFVD